MFPVPPVSSDPSVAVAAAEAAVPDALAASKTESNRTLTVAWLVLLAITATTYWLGDGHLPAATGSMVPVLVLCALTFVKGLLVSLEFLELRHAPALWRWLVCGWLTLVLLLIALAFWGSHW